MKKLKKHLASYEESRGNVLFLILIAVALFAALSFAISQSMRGSDTKGASQEKTQLLVDQLSQYSSSLAQAVTRVILGNGCTIDNVNFASERWATDEYDLGGLAPPGGNCNIFSQKGGGVIWQAPPFEAVGSPGNQYAVTGSFAVHQVGTESSELTMMLEVTKSVCLKANDQDKVANPGGNPPVASAGSRFPTPISPAKAFGPDSISGSSTRFPSDILVGDTVAPELRGHQMGCYEAGTGSGIYVFYQVLIPR